MDPAARERQSEYGDQVRSMLTEGTNHDALAWVRAQEGVVEAAASETALMFRVEGGRPRFFFRAPPEGEPGASARSADLARAQVAAPVGATFASAVTPVVPPPSSEPLTDVVGDGTAREMRQNGKRALFLEPWASHLIRGLDGVFPQLRALPDYADPSAITYRPNHRVTPDEFVGWDEYDAIFVKTHGGVLNGDAFVSTGVREVLGDRDDEEVCDALIAWWADMTGVDCATQEEWVEDPETGDFLRDEAGRHITVDWVVVGVQPDFFWEQYGRHGGLHRAIVYIGACDSLSGTDLARSIAGASSAFLGWNGQPNRLTEADASRAILRMLIEERDTVQVSHARACDGFLCRDPGPDGAVLELHQNGPEPRQLRLYDLPTPRDPTAPDEILRDGAELKFRGRAGDDLPDQLEVMVEIIGVVDPGELDAPEATAITIAEDGSVADRYEVQVFVRGEVVASGSLGEDGRPNVEVTALGESTYRYTVLADLGFDVPNDGFETALKVVVELPEGGVSDYEVDVVLVEPAMGATVSVGDRTWEFQLSSVFGSAGCLTDTDQQITAAGHVDGDLEGASLWVDLRPGLSHVEVTDPDSGVTWLAAAERSQMTVLHLIPEGHSQVDSLTIEDGRARGTATFMEAGAFRQAWATNGAFPLPVGGSFEVRCR